MNSEYLKTALIFYAGAVCGSFFYTLALRYINGKIKKNPLAALFSRSQCPHCGVKTPPLFLLPLAGYFFARAKCGKCGGSISALYPLSEAAWGILLTALYFHSGISADTLLVFGLLSCALTIAIIDLRTQTIPDSLVIASALFAIYPAIKSGDLLNNFYGFLLMSIVFLVIMLIFPGSFGGGDLKYSSVIGFFLGLEFSIIALETALISGAVSGLIYAFYTRKGLKSKIPFGPFLTLGLITAVFRGREILFLYYDLIR